MAFTARLAPQLEAEAEEYAASVGLTKSALLSIALADYLKRQRRLMPLQQDVLAAKLARKLLGDALTEGERGARAMLARVESVASASSPMQSSGVSSPAPSSGKPDVTAPAGVIAPYRAPKSRSDPCPCGAKSPDGYPVKWKHCHGRSGS